jgi:hypothetical protein
MYESIDIDNREKEILNILEILYFELKSMQHNVLKLETELEVLRNLRILKEISGCGAKCQMI